MNEIGVTPPPMDTFAETDRQAQNPFQALVTALDGRKVRYCHWKSNVRLSDTMVGDEDLDILVSRLDAQTFLTVLSEVGFKLAETRYGGGHPGVIHAFAFSPERQKLFHVHAYFQVISGDSLVKSYRFPFEDRLFEGDRMEYGVPVPAPDLELMMFLLRIVLKHINLFEWILVKRHYDAVPVELSWLRDQLGDSDMHASWNALIPGAKDGEFDELVRVVADPKAAFGRLRLGVRLAWRLRGWRRLSFSAAFFSRLWRIGLLVISRLRRRRPRRLIGGGAVVAFVGPKASGKSTLGKALAACFGKQIDLRRVHVGKPPLTLLSAPLGIALPLLRRVMPGERSSEYQRLERRAEQKYSLPYVVRMTLLAHDRWALLLRCRRAASSGAIIVTDRYPSADIGAIDSSQFDDNAVATCGSRLKRVLMRLERSYYKKIPKPDLVIRLVAPIETTIHRDATRDKNDAPDPDAVRRRRAFETQAEFQGVPVLTVSTDCPLEQTSADVLQKVWQNL